MEASVSTTQRKRGRPATDSENDIRQDIIDVSTRLFAQQGYASTSIRQIADEAGVNGAMIHYYFGNKASLLMAALEIVTAPFAAALADMKQQGEAPVEDIVTMVFNVFSGQPDIPVLMTREVLLPGGAAQQAFIDTLASRLGGALPGLLANEQTQGRIRKNLDPASGALQLLSLCAFPFISRSLSEPVLGLSFEPDGIDHLREQVIELLHHGVMA